MATINPFYRFEDAIQVGSLGERAYIISTALDELFGSVNVSFAGQTISQVINTCNALADPYNENLQCNIVVDSFYTIDPVNPYPVQLFIYDSVLASLYPLLKISLVLIVNPTNGLVTTSSAWFMGALDENFNYSEPLCADELEAYKALTQYAETGSAIFPRTYSFDKGTGVASSLFKRLRPCKYDVAKGTAVRYPANPYARAAKPSLNFSKLSNGGKYIITLFNSLLDLAAVPGAIINDIYNSTFNWSIPEGYAITRFTDFSGIKRFQINIFSNKDGFALVCREDGGFEFQRFYTENYIEFNFLTNYPEATDLPYQPTEYNTYGEIFYDFDFCEFANCAYPKKESYLMPCKSGDEYQFNVLPYQSNVLPYDVVDVGIFDSNFNLVQKVGEAKIGGGVACECTEESCQPIQLTYSISSELWATYLEFLNQFQVPGGGTSVYFELYEVGNETAIDDVSLGFAPNVVIDDAQIASMLEGSNFTFEFNEATDAWEWTYSFDAPECGKEYFIRNRLIGLPEVTLVTLWTSENFDCSTTNPSLQFEAKVSIPAIKNGCYRFGLYRLESNFNGGEIELEPFFFPLANAQYNVIVVANGDLSVVKYLIVIPNNVTTYAQFVQYLNKCFANSVTISDPLDIFKICGYNSNFGGGDSVYFGTYDFGTDSFDLGEIGSTASSVCQTTDGEPINEVYAFSNLISLDDSDCFSTMIQYWADSDAIAEGFEYYNDWFQQVRLGINGGGKKPIITESTYRQSNGVTRRPQNKQDLSIDLHTDFLDFETQSALVDATRHTNFVVDGQNIFVNGDIEVATIQDFTTQSSFEDLAQVKFSALIQGYQPKNSTCVNC